MKYWIAALAMTCWAASAAAGQATDMLNKLRSAQGLAPVVVSKTLEKAAAAHATDMARKGFFSHDGSDGSSVMTRAQRAGYAPCMVAENIAMGQTGLQEVMTDWAGSPGHRRNMLSRDVTEFGLVRAQGNIWVMVLGRSGC